MKFSNYDFSSQNTNKGRSGYNNLGANVTPPSTPNTTSNLNSNVTSNVSSNTEAELTRVTPPTQESTTVRTIESNQTAGSESSGSLFGAFRNNSRNLVSREVNVGSPLPTNEDMTSNYPNYRAINDYSDLNNDMNYSSTIETRNNEQVSTMPEFTSSRGRVTTTTPRTSSTRPRGVMMPQESQLSGNMEAPLLPPSEAELPVLPPPMTRPMTPPPMTRPIPPPPMTRPMTRPMTPPMTRPMTPPMTPYDNRSMRNTNFNTMVNFNRSSSSMEQIPNAFTGYTMEEDRGLFLPNRANNMPMGVPMFPLYGYDNSQDLDKDLDYMKQLYPRACKKILVEVEDECDKLEYDGSCMFDEYPDKVCLNRIVDRIFDKLINMEEFQVNEDDSSEDPDFLETNEIFGRDRHDDRRHDDHRHDDRRHDHRRRHGRDGFFRDLIDVILFNEMHNRRRRFRSRKRWF